MANTFTKLVALGTAVASIGAITFEFTPYSSKDSLIKQGVDSLKAIVQGKDEALAKLQAEYDEVMANLKDANASLETARLKLEAIYQKITNEAWDEANGDILNFDFNTLIKDGDQFESNVDGNAIADILGLPAGSTTQQIIIAIQNLQEQIADLSQQVQNLQAQVAELQAEIATYKEEESALVLDLQQQIADLKARAENEANAIIDEANTEEQAQLDYINNTLTELGGEAVKEEVPEEDNGEGEVEESSVVLSGDWSQATEEQKTALLNMFDELGIEDIEVTPGTINPSISYLEVKVPEEAYNVMVAHEQYRPGTESIYLDSEGNIANKDVAAPNGKTANGYTQVRIAQQ